jgi:hypothetical protein
LDEEDLLVMGTLSSDYVGELFFALLKYQI